MKAVPDENIDIPAFVSKIPQHLLVGATRQERFIMNAISVIQENLAWQNPMITETVRQQKITNGRVKKMFRVYAFTVSHWGILVILCFLFFIYPIALAILSKIGLAKAAAWVLKLIGSQG